MKLSTIATTNDDLMKKANTDIFIDSLLLVQNSSTAKARDKSVDSTAFTTRTRRQQKFKDFTQRSS